MNRLLGIPSGPLLDGRLAEVARGLMLNRYTLKLANSISYLGTGFLKAIEASETESRLDAIERTLRLDRQQLDAARRDLEDRVAQGDSNPHWMRKLACSISQCRAS